MASQPLTQADQTPSNTSRPLASGSSPTQKSSEVESPSNPPILTDENEKFLERVTSRADTANEPESLTESSATEDVTEDKEQEVGGGSSGQGRWSWVSSLQASPSAIWQKMPGLPAISEVSSRVPSMPAMPSIPSMPSVKRQIQTRSDGADSSSKEEETKQERRDIASILSDLNTSALPSRFLPSTPSFNESSQKLLNDFTLILKDIVNGAPTAYDDLDKFLTQRHKQLQEMYKRLPPFLQFLVESLPVRLYSFFGAQAISAATAKKAEAAPSPDVKPAETSKTATGTTSSPTQESEKQRSRIPSLRVLLTERGAVSALLRSILEYLQAYTPAMLGGSNLIMSLAVFLLMFVFWYCHSRGRETRLEKEAIAAVGENPEKGKDENEQQDTAQGIQENKPES